MLLVLRIAWHNILLARRRTLLLGMAVATTAFMFFMLRAVAASVSEHMLDAATTLSAGHVNIGGFFKDGQNASAPILTGREQLRDLARKTVPESTRIIDRHRGWGRIISPASSINASFSGLIVAEEANLLGTLRLAATRDYRKDGNDERPGHFADLAKPNSAILFAAQAKKLEVGVGDSVTVITEASSGPANTADLDIVAIAEDIGFLSNYSILMPRQTVLDLYQLSPDTTGAVMVYLPHADQAQAVMDRLRQALKGAGYTLMDHDPRPFFMKFASVGAADWLGQQLDLTTWSDEISYMAWVTMALDLIAFVVLSILALIIGGGLMNSVWMSVRERTKEIGTMRAIGASRTFVAQLFVVEAMLLGGLASICGTGLGALLLSVINHLNLPIVDDGTRLFLMANTVHIPVHLEQLISASLVLMMITGAAALYPSWKAARMRPIEALMHSK